MVQATNNAVQSVTNTFNHSKMKESIMWPFEKRKSRIVVRKTTINAAEIKKAGQEKKGKKRWRVIQQTTTKYQTASVSSCFRKHPPSRDSLELTMIVTMSVIVTVSVLSMARIGCILAVLIAFLVLVFMLVLMSMASIGTGSFIQFLQKIYKCIISLQWCDWR